MKLTDKENINKVYKVFGKEKWKEVLLGEYESLSNTELEITKLRWIVYTAFYAVILTLSGYIWLNPTSDVILKKTGLITGVAVHLVACYFYFWFHRISIMYREYLKMLEQEIGLKRYSIRTNRPKIGPFTLRFYWGIITLLIIHIIEVALYVIKY
jgi:hypothetical protein